MDQHVAPAEGAKQWGIVATESGTQQVQQIPIPKPRNGELLVKVMAAPLNPSDMYMLKGMYDAGGVFDIHYPIVPGWEGAGIVVASGGGMTANRMVGKRIAFVRKNENDIQMILGGCYQQYVVVGAMTTFVLPDSVPYTIGSMFFVNPLTAMGLVSRIKGNKSRAAVQTGAASQCGRMIIKLCQMENIPLINIVRRDEQVKLLQEEYGAKYVLNSSTETFFDDLKKLADELKATTCIECIGGPFTAKLMQYLPSKTHIALYGCLSEKPLEGIDPLLMIGRNQVIRSFILGTFLKEQGVWIVQVFRKVARLMQDSTLHSKIHKTFTLSKFEGSVSEYYQNMTAGKMILTPHEDDEALVEGAKFETFTIKDNKTE